MMRLHLPQLRAQTAVVDLEQHRPVGHVVAEIGVQRRRHLAVANDRTAA